MIPAVCAAAMLLAACSGASDDATDSTGSPPDSGAPWPLTGLASDGEADVDAPVVVVKVDNVDAAFPQIGLDVADIVVEEPVEGGVTRLAVLAQSDVDTTIGPVRSVRSSDIGIVAPANGVLVASGGAPEALADLEAAGVQTALDGSTPGFERDSSRPSPHNLFVDLEQAYPAIEAEADGPPGPYFEFGDADVLESDDAASAGDITLTYSDAHTTRLLFDGEAWTRELATPDGFVADTVIALSVEQGTAGYLDPSGAPVPINLTEGVGNGWLAHAGRIVEIEWTKAEADDTWSFSIDGEAISVPAGRTYLALLPVTTGSLAADDAPAASPGA